MRIDRFKGKKRYIFLFIFGMMIFLYPTFSNSYYNYIMVKDSEKEGLSSSEVTQGLGDDEAGIDKTQSVLSDKEFNQIESDAELKLLLSKKLEYLKEYNKKLAIASGNVVDPFKDDEDDNIESQISKDIDDNSVFAYIKIDKIHQTLPVYLGATDEHLNKGVAVIKGTSIPVGGESTNSVIAGHTGSVERFFTDLPELNTGDDITIINPWGTLHYKVTGNKLIWPDQEEYLNVVNGKDILTLLTCYHGTTANDRLLVFAERYYPEETENRINENLDSYLSKKELAEKKWYEKPQTFLIGSMSILFFVFMYILLNEKK